MRYFYLRAPFKEKFFDYILKHGFCIPYENRDPKWISDHSFRISKYHQYQMELEDSEYLILKLIFDLKEEV